MPIELVMLSSHLILCHPLLLLLSVFPNMRDFCNELALCIRWPKYSASASVLPMNIQGLFPLGLTGLILLSKELSRVFSNTTVQKHQFFGVQLSLWRRQWQPTPALLPGKSHGWRSLVGCNPWGREESDMTERLFFHFHF